MMEFASLTLPEVIEVRPRRFGDHRGYFAEIWKRDLFAAHAIDIDWVQENQSLSAQIGTVRGLHFQAPPYAQAKLVRVLRGTIFDVAVDVRRGSPTWGQWTGCELSASAMNQLYVPIGFAHGFVTLTPDAEVCYKVSAPYDAASEGGVRWDDPDIAIDWPVSGIEPTLSGKDRVAPTLRALASPFVMGEY